MKLQAILMKGKLLRDTALHPQNKQNCSVQQPAFQGYTTKEGGEKGVKEKFSFSLTQICWNEAPRSKTQHNPQRGGSVGIPV